MLIDLSTITVIVVLLLLLLQRIASMILLNCCFIACRQTALARLPRFFVFRFSGLPTHPYLGDSSILASSAVGGAIPIHNRRRRRFCHHHQKCQSTLSRLSSTSLTDDSCKNYLSSSDIVKLMCLPSLCFEESGEEI